jgi:HEAT repeat protein
MRTRGRVALSLSFFAVAGAPAVVSAANAANKGTAVSLPASGGLQPIEVQVDPARPVVEIVVGSSHAEIAIDLRPDEANLGSAGAESIAIGNGKSVVHVRVPSRVRADVAWEAILAGRDPTVLWSGVTGLADGEAGELAGEGVDILPPDEAGNRVVVVGEVREDLRICGQTQTLLTPRVLDPQSLAFRGATMQRLPEAQRAQAERIIASAHGEPADPPLARLLLATGASTAIGAPAAVTDGDPATTWSEGRATDGHGEFLVMRAPADVPIARLSITIAPPTPSPHGAAPRSFFLVTEKRTIAVTLPEDGWTRPGVAYDIPLVDPLQASCLTLVLDKAYPRSGVPYPEVTIAELTAYSAFDAPGATLDQVAKALGGGGARGEAAKAVLVRSGDAGLAAAAAAFGSLDAAGRALAIDAAIGAGTCEASAPLLLTSMADHDREVARKGREKLERCGKRAMPALLAALRAPDDAQRGNAAKLAAAIAPGEAIDALVDALARGDAPTRGAVRSGLAKAARGAKKEKLAALVTAARGDDARLELVRALEEELPAIAPEGDAAIDALVSRAPSMRTRYLLVEPIATLARAADGAATARLGAMIASDPDPAVRAHAAERGAGVAGATSALARAADADDSPRARAAALEALAVAKPSPPVAPIARRLKDDEWTFVRSAAAATLAAFAPGPRVDEALEGAIADDAATVRQAAITALAGHRDAHAAKAIRASLGDEHEALEVRLAATKALAALCDRESTQLLTDLAQRAPVSMASDEDIQIGLTAAEALGELHPVDLAARLAPLAAKDARAEARTAAVRALAATPSCK